MISIKVPTVGESITEVTLLKWTKAEGAWVDRDEVIAELESEKATFEVNAEQAGVLFRKANEGDSILIGAILADIDETAAKPVAAKAAEEGGKANMAAEAPTTAAAPPIAPTAPIVPARCDADACACADCAPSRSFR